MEDKSCEKKVGRPKASVLRERVNLTLHPEILGEARRHAFQTNRSLSGLVEFSLRQILEGECPVN